MLNIGKQPIHIVGISCITSTEVASEKIGQLWAKFSSMPIKEKLENIISPAIFCIYSDYENGIAGRYRTTIGYAVKDLSKIPADLTLLTIPVGKYKAFPSKSPAVMDIVATWQAIWATDARILPRNFITDFELYDGNEATIYMGYS